MSFIVYGLPRSRTAWLSRFLTYGDWFCGHEEIRHARSIDDVKAWLTQPNTGTVETAGAPFWRLVQAMKPDIRTVVVRRPVADAVESLMRLGMFPDRTATTALMTRLDHKLDQIEHRVPGALSVRFEDLATEETCARVFEHCLPYQHDPAWWANIAPMNLQISMPILMRYYQAYRAPLAKVAAQAKWLMTDAIARKPSSDLDGLTIQVEPFESFFRDSQNLFAEHLVATDQFPDANLKNIELMRLLDRVGALQVVTARCNGRVFGYLMTAIGPSLDSPDLKSAIHTTFFASSEFKGLGMKLQRAAREALEARGVDEIVMRAGTRGDGPRMGALYRRMGAEDYGQLFRLQLGGI